jgi:hypothetical protein
MCQFGVLKPQYNSNNNIIREFVISEEEFISVLQIIQSLTLWQQPHQTVLFVVDNKNYVNFDAQCPFCFHEKFNSTEKSFSENKSEEINLKENNKNLMKSLDKEDNILRNNGIENIDAEFFLKEMEYLIKVASSVHKILSDT